MGIVIFTFLALTIAGSLFLLLRQEGAEADQEENDGPLEAYRASSLHEAHLIAGLMRQAGLAVTLTNENVVGLVGELPPHAVCPILWVRGQSDFVRAREIVELYEDRLNDADVGNLPEWTCSSCAELSPGNFETCWKCGKARS
jgi:hypothetical protein